MKTTVMFLELGSIYLIYSVSDLVLVHTSGARTACQVLQVCEERRTRSSFDTPYFIALSLSDPYNKRLVLNE